MNKKVINELKPAIRAVRQDAKRIGLAFDGVKAFVSLATDSEGLAVVERELRVALASMRANIDEIANAIDTNTIDVNGESLSKSTAIGHSKTHGQTISTGQNEISHDGEA